MSQQLTIEKINAQVANDWHWLNPRQKRLLKSLLIETWNAGAKYNSITSGKIKIDTKKE